MGPSDSTNNLSVQFKPAFHNSSGELGPLLFYVPHQPQDMVKVLPEVELKGRFDGFLCQVSLSVPPSLSGQVPRPSHQTQVTAKQIS